MANKVLGFIRNIFARDNYTGGKEDGPKYRSSKYHSIQSPNSGFGSVLNQNMYGGNGTGGFSNDGTLQEDLLTRYADYEDMDEIPELSAALDIVSDDATQSDHITGQIVHVKAEDTSIADALNTCFHTNLRIDEQIWEICRTMLKYGNDFEEHIVTESEGLIGINFLSPPQVRRVDDPDGGLLGFIFDQSGHFQMNTNDFEKRLQDRNYNEQQYAESARSLNVLEDWEVTHFRLRSKQRGSQYGWSFLESARWTVKRLVMLEDAALLYKLTRAQQRFVFNVDVGDLPPNEALNYIDKVKNRLKKSTIVNKETGKLDLSPNVWANDEDFFIPTRKDKPSMSVEDVGGFDSSFYMEDLDYFKDKLYAAIKIPKDYLNYSEDSVSKANLSTEDMRFARTIIRIQRELRTGLINMGRVHLAALGHDPDTIDFDVYMTPPSSIFEMAMMEVREAQLSIAGEYREFVDDFWIMTNILKFDEEEIKEINARLKKQKEEDDPFGENRFPTVESRGRAKRISSKKQKELDMLGEEIFKKDRKSTKALKELKELAADLKQVLRKK